MLTVNKLVPRGRGLAPALLKRATQVELDWDVRSRSRFDATDSAGRRLGVFLPRGQVVRGGDVLVAEDGSLVRVRAAAQPVLVVRHCPQHGTPFDLLRQMHLIVSEELAPFEPEAGAYASGGHAHGHDHDHGHGRDGAQAQAAPAHVHGPGCRHDHGH